MPETRKVLGQSAPALTTLTALYTAPSATQAVVSTVTICNRSATATTYRLSIAIAGAADATSQYVVYDATIAGNDTVALTQGWTLGATDVIRCYAGAATLTFVAFGVELT